MSVIDPRFESRLTRVFDPKALEMQIGREELVLLESLDRSRLEGQVDEAFQLLQRLFVIADQLKPRFDQIQANGLPTTWAKGEEGS